MKQLNYFVAITAISLCSIQTKGQNPYDAIGKKTTMLTLTNGKYPEYVPYDSIQRIGSIVLNVKRMTILAFLDRDSINMAPEVSSRWWSIDPHSNKYPNISPYVFGLNNPIFFIDPDGGVIVDSQGKEVVVTFGKANAPIFKYKDGSEVTDKKFIADAKPVLASMSKTEVGRTVVKAMNDAQHNVSIEVDKSGAKYYNEKTQEYSSTEQPGFTPLYGQTESTLNEKGELASTKITIFEGTIDKIKETPKDQIYVINIEDKVVAQSDFTKEQIIGATGTHEGTHATDKASNSKLGATKPEDKPNSNELKFYQQSDPEGTKVK